MKKIVHLEKRFNNNKNVSIQSDVEYFSHLQRLENIKKERGKTLFDIIANIGVHIIVMSVFVILFVLMTS